MFKLTRRHFRGFVNKLIATSEQIHFPKLVFLVVSLSFTLQRAEAQQKDVKRQWYFGPEITGLALPKVLIFEASVSARKKIPKSSFLGYDVQLDINVSNNFTAIKLIPHVNVGDNSAYLILGAGVQYAEFEHVSTSYQSTAVEHLSTSYRSTTFGGEAGFGSRWYEENHYTGFDWVLIYWPAVNVDTTSKQRDIGFANPYERRRGNVFWPNVKLFAFAIGF